MEIALSTTQWLDRAADMLLVSLPSWGDPILPQTWRHSEEEIRASFTWPRERIDSIDRDCIPMIMSDPLMDREMTSLLRGSYDSEDPSEYSSNDDDSQAMNRTDDDVSQQRGDHDESSRYSVVASSRSDPRRDSSDSSFSCQSDSSMDSEAERETLCPVEPEESPEKWSVEAYYNHNLLCFKLRTNGGAYMQLMANEVLPSLQVLLEDSMDPVVFCVQRTDGQMMAVDNRMILPVVSQILTSQPHIITPTPVVEERDGPEDLRDDNDVHVTMARKSLKVPARACEKDNVSGKKRKNRIGSALRALSGRAKIRPRPVISVE